MTGLSEYPVNDNGAMLGYAGTGMHDLCKWVKNAPFTATMTVIGTSRGRSSVKFHLQCDDGKPWEMFVTDFCDLAKHATIKDGVVTGIWEVAKRGANYGLRLAK